MLHERAGLSSADLSAIAGLEQRVLAADGGRLKLEWGSLRSRSGDRVEDVLFLDGDDLVGFAGIYQHGGPIEVAGMVDPGHRRRGVGTELLAAVLAIVPERGADSVLLVCPRTGPATAFATGRGGVFEHAEHALVLTGEPADGPSDPAVALRPATVADLPQINRLVAAGFGPAAPVDAEGFDSAGPHVVVEYRGTTIGYLRPTLVGDAGAVHGFVIDAALRGRGIGRDVLRRCCRQLRADGAHRVGLEVAVDNERALGLYTSLGFEPVVTEDYYRVPSSG